MNTRRLLGAVLLAAAALPATAGTALRVCSDPANLPYSNQRGEGFENRIARLLAQDLGADLDYTWNLQRRGFLRRTLNAQACDVVLGVPAGLQGVLQTRPYYSASYVFVTRQRAALALRGIDDPRLATLRIGLQAVGAEGSNPAPARSLARRGWVQHVTGFPAWAEEGDETPQARIVDAVARGEIDVAIVWGPIGRYFAAHASEPLAVTPVDADPLLPELPFRFEMAVGVRRDDSALRDRLQQALDRHGDEIAAILRDYGIPSSGD
ncbi:MAG: quinoprotein dehydrogenase-associated putative ABC transporter substrate-binding protein [Rubrivivax sp.]